MNSFGKLCAVALAMLAAGCATAPSEPAKPCPPLAIYSNDEQALAGSELAILEAVRRPAPCIICRMMDDYLLLRDQCR